MEYYGGCTFRKKGKKMILNRRKTLERSKRKHVEISDEAARRNNIIFYDVPENNDKKEGRQKKDDLRFTEN
ncbi:hypothetical protein SK128_028169 [Halocaridina rubra]|uniref:Uncharacterized protein n=1 Tax=Halocaridina rubra TaxID=373956 RepID=A0AAN8XV22_HALRR